MVAVLELQKRRLLLPPILLLLRLMMIRHRVAVSSAPEGRNHRRGGEDGDLSVRGERNGRAAW